MEKVLAGTSVRLVALAHPSLYHAEARRDPNLLRWAEAHSSVVFEGMQWPEALPTGLSHDVFLRSGDREWPAGSISAAPGATAARVGRPQYVGDLRAERVDVVLRPNASQAPETLDVLRVWPHEFVVRDVPVAPDPRGLPVRAGK
jgi:hypothetical protein